MSLWRNAIALLSVWLLTACGFQPMYGDAALQQMKTPLQGNLIIDPVGGTTARIAQILKNSLEDRFNPEGTRLAQPDYHLKVSLSKNLIASVVQSDGTILRYILQMNVTYTVTKNGQPKPLFTGTMRRQASYNLVPNENFATYEADQDTTDRLVQEIAEELAIRISTRFTGKSG